MHRASEGWWAWLFSGLLQFPGFLPPASEPVTTNLQVVAAWSWALAQAPPPCVLAAGHWAPPPPTA